ncbi:hypothetical protein TanjilG_12339 [Lupinus angustifolius]|uniref:Thioredoxin-like fold domain-containing protein n=1 Tax=Lupinus angustifolius TaxID=3871 RepID=A0A4P1QY64_LUPAN|nr:hypothetical protein TanjilG_12339 [Lupinus angustifolius]
MAPKYMISIVMLLLQLLILFKSGAADYIPPAKSDGFGYKAHSINLNSILIEAFYDPLCPYSRDSWPPLKKALHHYGHHRVSLVVHLLPLPYHDNAFVASRALHIVNGFNKSATYPLLEWFFKNQEKFYNVPTRNLSRASIVKEIVKSATKVVGNSYHDSIKNGFNDTNTDLLTRVSFKLLILFKSGAADYIPPAKSDGFGYKTHSINLDSILIEVFYDPLCPDSRDSWPPLKKTLHHYGHQVSLVVHLLPLPYHDNAFVASRALHIVNGLNTSATYPLLEWFFENQDKFYNAATRNLTRASIVEEIVKSATEVVGKSYHSSIKNGFNDTHTDHLTRISFKYAASRGVYGTPFFYVNGFLLPDNGAAVDYNAWRKVLDPLNVNSKMAPKYMISIVMLLLQLQLLILFKSGAADYIPPAKSDGFGYKIHSINLDSILIEAFYDPLCPDSRDSWPPLKKALHHYGHHRVSLIVHLLPLPTAHKATIASSKTQSFGYLSSQGFSVDPDKVGELVVLTRQLVAVGENTGDASGEGGAVVEHDVYHDNAFVASRALHIVNGLNSSATYPLLEWFFKNQEKFYNAPTRNLSRASIVKEIVKSATEVIGNSDYNSVKNGFNDTNTDHLTRISFKYAASRGVYGTPFFYVNGFVLPDTGDSVNYTAWRKVLDPLVGAKKGDKNEESLRFFL